MFPALLEPRGQRARRGRKGCRESQDRRAILAIPGQLVLLVQQVLLARKAIPETSVQPGRQVPLVPLVRKATPATRDRRGQPALLGLLGLKESKALLGQKVTQAIPDRLEPLVRPGLRERQVPPEPRVLPGRKVFKALPVRLGRKVFKVSRDQKAIRATLARQVRPGQRDRKESKG